MEILNFTDLIFSRFKLKSLSSPSTEKNQRILNFLTLTTLVIFMGALSLLNFSLAFLIAVFYVPTSILTITRANSIFHKVLQLLLLLLAMPLIYFSIIFGIYTVYFDKSSTISLNDSFQSLNQIESKLYNFAVVSKLTNVWTLSLINVFLTPIWSLLWLIAFKKIQQAN